MDAAPTDTDEPCQFDSCPAGSPFIDFSNDTDQLYYVNSYPATAMQYGLDRAAEVYPDNEIDIAVAGPNVGREYSHPRLPERLPLNVYPSVDMLFCLVCH